MRAVCPDPYPPDEYPVFEQICDTLTFSGNDLQVEVLAGAPVAQLDLVVVPAGTFSMPWTLTRKYRQSRENQRTDSSAVARW